MVILSLTEHFFCFFHFQFFLATSICFFLLLVVFTSGLFLHLSKGECCYFFPTLLIWLFANFCIIMPMDKKWFEKQFQLDVSLAYIIDAGKTGERAFERMRDIVS